MLRLNRDKSNQMLYTENMRPLSPMNATKRNQKSPSRTALDNKLQQLEKKQYELTKKVKYSLNSSYSRIKISNLNFSFEI